MLQKQIIKTAGAFLSVLLLTASLAGIARAEVKEVRLAKQYGLSYLSLIVMEEQKLIEKHAKKAGLGDIKVSWSTFSSGSVELNRCAVI